MSSTMTAPSGPWLLASCGPSAVSRVRCRSTEGAEVATVVSSALAAVMASRIEFRSLPKDASSAMLLCSGASFMYLRMESEPHRPWSWMRHTSMPQEARCIAPVALNVWPENRGAPVIVWSGRSSSLAISATVADVACLVAAPPDAVGKSGAERREEGLSASARRS